MGLIQAFRRIEKGFAWSFLGFVLAACFGGLAIYTEFFKSRSAKLEYEVISNTPVLTTREEVPALKILYDNLDIRQTKQTLSVVSIRVRNTGDADILNGNYDERAPVGLDIGGGTILEPRIVAASNDYLRTNAGCKLKGPVSLDFVPIILERQEFYVVKFLVLHPDSTAVQVRPRGKVAGVRQITLTDSSTADQSPGLLATAIAGPPKVQLLRLVAYTVVFVVLAIAVVGSTASVGTWWTGRRRRRVVRRFRASYGGPLDAASDRLFASYTSDGPQALAGMSRALKRDPDLRRAARTLARQDGMRGKPEQLQRHELFYLNLIGWDHPQRLVDVGLIRREGDSLALNAGLKKVLDDFMQFLQRETGELAKT
jgi:hypothetical protein